MDFSILEKDPARLRMIRAIYTEAQLTPRL